MKKLLLICLCMMMSGCYETSSGKKIGIIVKCASEGIIFRTYECEIIRGGMNSASGTIGKSFHFTVEDKNLISVANYALDQQKEVIIKYHMELFTLISSGNTDSAFVDAIEIKN